MLSLLLMRPAWAIEEAQSASENNNSVHLKVNITKRNLVTSSYKISPGDILTFSVNEEPEMYQDYIIVRPDGYATIQPVGEVYVAGMNIADLAKSLESQLVAYINKPQVYINVREFHIPKLYLLGAVMKPGTYQPSRQDTSYDPNNHNKSALNGRMRIENTDLSIFNVLVNAGGVKYNADLSNIEITHSDGEKLNINLFDLIVKGERSQDFLLQEGDAIFVSQLENFPYGDEEFKILTASGLYPEKFPVRVLGEVEKPGLYYVSSDTPYLNTAVALSEGFKHNAVKSHIIIHRKVHGDDMSKIVVNPNKIDFVLRPNDVINVNDSKFDKTVRGTERFSRIAMPFVWLGNWF